MSTIYQFIDIKEPVIPWIVFEHTVFSTSPQQIGTTKHTYDFSQFGFGNCQ